MASCPHSRLQLVTKATDGVGRPVKRAYVCWDCPMTTQARVFAPLGHHFVDDHKED